MATTESSLEKLLRLATANVRGYQRFERGKEQTVRPHTETRAQEAAGNGWIPEPKWVQGQLEWEKEGEAAWKSKGAEARARDEAAERPRGGVRPDADRRSHATSPRAQARAQRMAARGGRLQDRVEAMEQDRQADSGRVENHPMFNRPAPGTSPADQLIHDAATRAAQDAMVQSGMVSQKDMANVMSEMESLRSQLAGVVQEEQLMEKVEHKKREEGRAKLAIGLLGIIAGFLVIAFTGGGMAGVIGEVLAFKWTADIAKELITYHGVESGKHPLVRKALANPRQAAKGAAKAAAPVAKAAAQTLGSPLRRK